MDRFQVDTVVVGAGVVGIAVAARLAATGRDVYVIELQEIFGSETSSRNSEVIHAGIYYPENSLKARFCVAGKQQLYDYCGKKGIAHRRCGKLIVASEFSQQARLQDIFDQGKRNGVNDLVVCDRVQLHKKYPELLATMAIWSPSTGIIDSHQLMLELKQDAESKGAQFLFKHEVLCGYFTANCIDLELLTPENERCLVRAGEVINCAGLGALQWLQRSSGLPLETLPEPVYAKGNYFALRIRPPFDCLVYPIPEEGGLGVHLTLDLSGAARFGPDVEWIDSPDYQVNSASLSLFYQQVRKYWPALPDGAFQPDFCGVRPKLRLQGKILNDFVLHTSLEHGIPGFISLLGIESPGLTCCLTIAEEVQKRLNGAVKSQ